jgi:hypothetical protein
LGIALFWELIIVFICIICILIFILTVVPGHNLGVRRHFFIVYKLFVVCARCGESTWIMRRTDSHCWFKE